jgi:hypothetical protein
MLGLLAVSGGAGSAAAGGGGGCMQWACGMAGHAAHLRTEGCVCMCIMLTGSRNVVSSLPPSLLNTSSESCVRKVTCEAAGSGVASALGCCLNACRRCS